MSNKVIRVENLGKQYRLGSGQNVGQYKTFRGAISHVVKAPVKRAIRILQGQPYGAAEVDTLFWALQELSFEVDSGEVLGVIGRNGAGKSTLLKILSRITEPDTGRAEIRGRVGSLLEVGTGFHPELTGRENIMLNGAILGMRRKETAAKFDDIVAFAEVEKFIDTPTKFYSSGMYVRLAFAVAAHMQPDILLVDEVLAVGDVAFRKKCLGKMNDIAQGGRTILFVSHNMSAINQLCSRCIVLDEGRKIVDDVPSKAIEVYLAHGNSSSGKEFVDDPSKPAQIVEAVVLNSKSEGTERIHYQEEFFVSVRINVKEASDLYHVLLLVRDSLNNSIIFTTDKDLADSALESKVGSAEYRVKFPSKLLRPDGYNIRLMLIRRERGRTFGGEVLSDNENSPLGFEIVDFESRRSTDQRYGDAAVAPEIPWELEMLNDVTKNENTTDPS